MPVQLQYAAETFTDYTTATSSPAMKVLLKLSSGYMPYTWYDKLQQKPSMSIP
jgi:hypothetical protein